MISELVLKCELIWLQKSPANQSQWYQKLISKMLTNPQHGSRDTVSSHRRPLVRLVHLNGFVPIAGDNLSMFTRLHTQYQSIANAVRIA